MNLFSGGYQMRDDGPEEGRWADSLLSTVAEYLVEHAARDAIIKTLLEALQVAEWSGVNSNGLPRCPICYGKKSENWHYGDCKLAAAIALATKATDKE